jgi:hypothetical protein
MINSVEELACEIYDLPLSEYKYIKEELFGENKEENLRHYIKSEKGFIIDRYNSVLAFIAGYCYREKLIGRG